MPGLRIALAQLDLWVGDIAGNAARVIGAASEARDALGARLIVFPELTLTSYPPEDLLLRPGLTRAVAEALERIARSITGIAVILGHPHPHAGSLYNACSLIRGGMVAATYHKQQLPNYGVFDEKRYFSPGSGPTVVSIEGVPTALSICEDIWVEGTAAQARAAGARLIVNINASPFHTGKGPEREAVLRRALREGGLPILYLNLVGGQDELVFDGGSVAMDSLGRIARRAPEFSEGVFVVEMGADLLPGEIAPVLAEEEAVYAALVLGVRDYVAKNGFQGAVLGLSGGIDSALALCIAVDALGPAEVEAVLMPSRYTAAMSVVDARAQAEALGVAHRIIAIEPAVVALNACLSEVFAGRAADTTEENIQARCRGVILMAISNKTGRLVLTTGNKSEMAVGYATLYGDMAGGFAPLKDVPKTLVYRLARWRNARGPVISERVFVRPPSAELAPDQRDEDNLPPYAVLDPILERYVERDQAPEDIVAAGFDPQTVARVVRLVDRNEYKRRQAAPGVRITRRAFGRDRRYPISSGYRED
jgi:NAD+ synthase (glutamine-hydrolysing)